MFPIRNNQVREFCRDVLDVDYIEYVSGRHIIKRNLDSERQYIELAELFSYNKDLTSKGKDPYVSILADESGYRYARLSDECTDYAFNNDFSFISECKERDKRHVPLRNASSKLVDTSLEDKICEKCGNVLGLDYSKAEFMKMIYDLTNKNIQNASPRDAILLKSIDFPGSYLN